ncbi:S-layer homology domain-containing protein, partial [Paenibacillus sp. MCAF20]
VKALDLKATGTTEFEDVSADAWYAEAVAAASQAGIVNGLDNTTFAPTAKITREQMATILVKTIELKAGKSLNAKAESTFIDRDEAAAWALKYIDVASEAGLVQGREGNQFAPKALLTRAESAQVVFSLLAGTK